MLGSLLASNAFEPVSALVSRNRELGVAHLLDRMPPGAPVYVAERNVMDAIAGFPIHRGVLALARPLGVSDPLEIGAERLVIGIQLANHDNVGGILRCCAAFGASAMFDASSADPLYRKAIRVSAGASFRVPHRHAGSPLEIVASARQAGYCPLALSPRGSADIRDVDPEQRIALVVGAEGPGLPDEVLRACDTARIGMAEGQDSLNVTVATGIALHALARR